MKYIIDEEEFKNLDFTVTMSQKPREEVSSWIKIMESKQPVEQVRYRITDNTRINDTKIFRFTMTNCELAKTTNIKIYIQKVKEKNV